MAKNKVVYNGQTIIDLTDTTATASDVAQGKYFYGADGVRTAGTATGGGGLTQHTIHLEFTDSSDADVSVGYDDSWIASLIATSKPPNYGAKIVDAAYLDGVQWYIRETWELVWEGNARANADTPYNYFWISALADVYPVMGSVWRITADGVEYRCETSAYNGNICIGNTKYNGGPDTGSDAPFSFYNAGWGAMVGDTELAGEVDHVLKFERLVT